MADAEKRSTITSKSIWDRKTTKRQLRLSKERSLWYREAKGHGPMPRTQAGVRRHQIRSRALNLGSGRPLPLGPGPGRAQGG